MCVCASAYCAQPRDRNFRAHCRASRPVNKKIKNTNKNHHHQNHHNHNDKGKRRFYLPPRRNFFSLPLLSFFLRFLSYFSILHIHKLFWKNTIFRDFLSYLFTILDFFFRFCFFHFFTCFYMSIFSEIWFLIFHKL